MGFNKKLGDITPVVPEDLKEVLAYWKTKIDAITTATIVAGFDMEINDVMYHFKYSLTDQSNMANMRADALTSIQLLLLDSTKLEAISVYGLDSNGNIDRSKAPTDTSDTWSREWPVYIDGVKTTLHVNALMMLSIARKADDHVNDTKTSMTAKYLAPLQACTSVDAVNTMAINLKIESLHRSLPII